MAAGPADLHEHIATQFGVGDGVPCADAAFLVPLKRSPEFRGLRSRLAGQAPHGPADSWQDDGFHFFVFALRGENGHVAARSEEVPVAVFAMHPEAEGLVVSAVVVSPTERGTHAEITNLREPSESYIAPLPSPATVSIGVAPTTAGINGNGHTEPADHRRN